MVEGENDGRTARQTVSIRIFWSARPETKDQLAARTLLFATRLADLSPFLGGWKNHVRSRRAAAAATIVPLSREALLREFRAFFSDIPRKPMPALGYMLSLWTGRVDGPSASLSIHAGASSSDALNSVVLSIDSDGFGTSVPRAFLQKLLVAAVDFWEPEYGTAGYGLFYDLAPARLDIDWLMYRVNVNWKALPPGVLMERHHGGGALLTLGDNPPRLADPADAHFVRGISSFLPPP